MSDQVQIYEETGAHLTPSSIYVYLFITQIKGYDTIITKLKERKRTDN